jgi:hypothetical protein
MWQPLVDAGTLQVVYLDEATAALATADSLSPLERASLLLARVTVSPRDREADDALAVEFGATLVPLRGERLWKEFHDFFVNLYLEKYATITYTEVLSMIASSEIFDGIGNNISVKEYAEKYAEQATQAATLTNAVALVRAGIPLEQVASILNISEERITERLRVS